MTRKKHPAFSVVIPTLWKPATFTQLLQHLEDSSDVLEIIIIDNDRPQRPNLKRFTKVRIIDNGENMFVNPSWNLGVEMANSTAICLCNDDVLFAGNLLSYMRSQSLRGIVGLDPASYRKPIDQPPIPSLTLGADLIHNWGSILFLKRCSYQPIPSNLKIWWGDAWLAQEMWPARKVSTAVFTKHSESARSHEFNSIKASDTHLWQTQYNKPRSIARRIQHRILRIWLKLEESHVLSRLL